MATGQVVGRHEVFEYTYKVGPAEERKRIKLVVIQRRDQRRKSLIAAQKYLESAPVKLRVNLHRAQYGDPEVTSGSRQVPITLRRKIKPATRTTTRVIRAPPQARAAHGLLTPPHTAPPPPEPARIELVDRPVPPPPSDSPGILYAEPDPIVVVPSSDHSHSHGHGRDSPSPPPVPPSPSGSSISVNRPGKVKRSNSFGSSFRRFPSLMGLIRRNSKNTTTPPTVTTTVETHHAPGYFDHDAPRSPGSRDMIIEERDSELGSPVGGPVGYGPPSVAGSRIGRKPVPPIPDSPPVSIAPSSTRSRTFSFGRRPSVSGSPRNRLVKASPRHVPLPDSVRDPSIAGSPFVTGGFPAESHDGRSVRSRRTERSVHQTPEYVHDEYLHNSPSAHSRSLRDPSIVHHEHGREPSITQLSMRDGSVVNGDRSLQLHGGESFNERSMHGDRSLHGGERSLHGGDRSLHGGDRSMHNGSDHRSSGRSLQGHSLHNRSAHDLPSDGYRSPSIPDLPTRDRASSDGGENDHGQWSPRSGSVSDLHRGASPSLQAPSHISSHRGSHDPSHRGVSPSLHAPAPSSQRAFSPSLQDPHSRGASPLSHGHSRREGSPSIHALSHRDGSPSIHGHSHRDQSHSRGASPSLHAPSYHGTNGNGITHSPPESMHAPSVKSRAASSVASSRVPMSSIGGRFSSRPKSPLSASGSSHASSRMTNRPSGPEITPVPSNGAPSTHAPSVASHRTGASRNVVRSPLAAYRVALPESSAPSDFGGSVFGSSVFGSSVYGSAVPHSRAPSAAGISRAPSAAAISRAPSAAAISRAPSAAPTHISRAPSAAGIIRAPSAAGTNRVPSVAGTTRAPSAAGTTRGPPSVAGTTRGPPSVASTTRGPPSVAGTARAPSVAGTARAPSEAGFSRAPSAAGHHRSGSVSRIPRAPSAAGIQRAPSAAGTHRAPNVAGIQRSSSAAGISRAPSAAGIVRAPSAAGVPLPPSVAASQRIPPSVIGSRHVPPSIAGSAPSVTAPSRHTPPPEPEFAAAPSDIAPESESHGGAALRAQARLEGDKMRMAFEASQEAYREGDGERAKELATMGRGHQTRMQELHAEAAEQVFQEKNGGRELGEIDLHGLYVKEALSRLSQFIREAPIHGQTNVRVITGKGLHSEGEPQILPAVEEALRKKGLRHHTDEANAGVIVVELGPRSPVSD